MDGGYSKKGMTPSLFEGLQARDETSYCVELGASEEQSLKNHWNTFITAEDFAWLAKTGINAVRIPIGHWIFGPGYPYHRSYGASFGATRPKQRRPGASVNASIVGGFTG